MLYSARHMGMGGAAIGYVNDPSALFHNPAGLAHTQKGALTADFSLLLARVHSSPNIINRDVDSELTVAPLFLLGGAYRIAPRVTAGLGVFPIASAGAKYRYPGGTVEDETRLVFIEGTPAVAVDLPGRVRIGLGYRLTFVSLERYQGDRAGNMPGLDFQLQGFNLTGFRAGAQWAPLPWLQVGAVYRHKTETKVTNDRGIALGTEYTDVETTFVLPSKAGLGGRADWGRVGVAFDVEYLWNSQNEGHPLEGKPPATPTDPDPARVEVANVFDWSDAVTFRAGAEYRLLPGGATGRERLALRLGYVHDGKTTNQRYPSAFGTPPGPTQVFTGGVGWNAGRWQASLAYAFRFGEGDVRREDVMDPANRRCAFCGYFGNDPYRIRVHGLYVDFGYAF